MLAILGSASARHELVTFAYTSRTGGTTTRRVEPYRQVHFHLRWYLLAWDLGRADWRTFRLDRISGISATGTPFTPRPRRRGPLPRISARRCPRAVTRPWSSSTPRPPWSATR